MEETLSFLGIEVSISRSEDWCVRRASSRMVYAGTKVGGVWKTWPAMVDVLSEALIEVDVMVSLLYARYPPV